MKNLLSAIFLVGVIAICSNSALSQGFYQTSGGSYMTGYGQVNGSFGYAMATQQMYQTVQMNLQRSINRAAMVKKWGEAAVRKAELAAANKNSSGSAKSSNPKIVVPEPPPAPKFYGRYRHDSSVNMAKTVSNALVDEPDERELLKKTIEAVQGVYQEEASAKGMQNNFAGGMTFFLIMMATVYNDAPEATDELTTAVYDAVNQSIDSSPDFEKVSNKDKQTINDLMIAYSALPLGVYIEGKQNGNAETVQLAKVWAGEMIKLVLKVDPKNVKFDGKTLQIVN